jgi:hypothetical protein
VATPQLASPLVRGGQTTAFHLEAGSTTTREEVNDMDETTDTLVVGVSSTPVVQDRTEIQLSDGMDDGETRDPA